MTWTATLAKKTKEHGRYRIEVVFTDGVETHQRTYNLTSTDPKYIKRLLRSEVTGFEAINDQEFNYPVGSTIDITPDPIAPPDPPTQAELDRAAWFDDYRQLQAMLKVTTGIPALATPQANAAIANLRNSLEADWLNSYLGGIK